MALKSGARVVVVGGGITGLVAAYRLSSQRPDITLRLLESDTRVGGKIRTEREHGLIVEAGPDAMLASKPAGVALCGALGIELLANNPGTRRIQIRKAGTLHAIPTGLNPLAPRTSTSLLELSVLSEDARERAAREESIPPAAPDDETVEGFYERRFGAGMYRDLIAPMIAGIYGGEGRSLSIAATLPHVVAFEREHGSVIAGAAHAHRENGDQRSGFVTPAVGMEQMVAALASRVGEAIRTNTTVRAVHRADDAYDVSVDDGESLQCDAVMLALPTDQAAVVVGDFDAALADLLGSIPWSSSATVSLAWPIADFQALPSFDGYLVGDVHSRARACTVVSEKFPHRAPPEIVLLRVFVNGASHSDAELLEIALAEVTAGFRVVKPPRYARSFRWPSALPQFTPGHSGRVAAIRERLAAHPGLEIAGAGLDGVGIPDCIVSAQHAVERLLT